MIKRVFDLDLLLESIKGSIYEENADQFKLWLSLPRNLMFADGPNVGLATWELPGTYTLHWFYKVRGREAIDLGKAMIKNLFDNYDAQVVRGIIREDLKASRWAARQVGFKSKGLLTFADGTVDELFIVTKEEFNEFMKRTTHNG